MFLSPKPQHATMRRYVGGQRLYFQAARPWERAAFIVDNFDFTSPKTFPPEKATAIQ
ncbi:hypothetical protein AAGW05_17220 [Arthrobacter sp. LAPM80]|uniref:hypothetical protein n=1 Tax=Arthrobacter sp. LAPM80 TaxID=3141788 RepID=UPI00398B1495